MQKSETIAALAKSLAKAQGEIENATKSSTNPHFRSKYADLAEVLNTVRPVFSSNGLSFVQMPSFSDGVVMVETLLAHESGEWIGETASSPIAKQDAQGVGSAITYLRRYSLAAFAGIAQEDDDANASIAAKAPAKQLPEEYEKVNVTDIAAIRQALVIAGKTESAALAHWKLESMELIPKSWVASILEQLKPKAQ
jgi:hypothetical protein